MHLVVPALSDACPAAAALRGEGLRPDVRIVDDDRAYAELITELWRRRTGFIIVEHDIIPWPGAVAGLWACPRPYCMYRYPIGGLLAGTLGCVKFGAGLLAALPDLPATFSGAHWSTLDVKITNALWNNGVRAPHVHQPAVAHLHAYPIEEQRHDWSRPTGVGMKIRMSVDISGTRGDGRDWPRRGESIMVDDAEGAELCASGMAEPVAQKDSDDAETATAAKPEAEERDSAVTTKTGPTKAAKPKTE